MPRAIIHADMDAFYASVEQKDNPELKGKPVIVGGSVEARGVVSAASYEAREHGVHSAMPMVTAKRMCPHGIFLPVRMERYREFSQQIREIFFRFTPLVEPLALDEAFLDVTGSQRLFGVPREIGLKIKAAVKNETGLTVSVGVAPNKFLAKLASGFNKPDGFLEIKEEEKLDFLAPLPVHRIWGVGKSTARLLNDYGVMTVGDLRDAPFELLSRRLGKMAETIVQLAKGEDDRPVVPDAEAKSIGSESTFPVDVTDIEALERSAWEHSEDVAARLRKQGLTARTITLKLRYGDFRLVTRSTTLDVPASSTDIIARSALELLHAHLGPHGHAIRLLGVSVSNLSQGSHRQLSLFDKHERERSRDNLDKAIDAIRERMGNDSIKRGRLL